MVLAAAAVSTIAPLGITQATATAAPNGAWHDGACRTNEPTATTIVIDFQRLDGNDGRAAKTIVRCLSERKTGPRRTGIDALRDAGLRIVGVGDSTDFVCRIQARPAVTEQLPTGDGDTHVERCKGTPPTTAYWSYWTAPRAGAPWTYQSAGGNARFITPGGIEGWSFALGVAANQLPRPQAVEAAAPPSVRPPVDPSPQTPAPTARPKPQPTPTPTPIRPLSPQPSPNPQPTSRAPIDQITPASPMPDATSQQHPDASHAAARWLVGELHTDHTMPGPSGTTDWGLTMDVLLALHAASAQPEAATDILRALKSHAADITEEASHDTGLVAKLLVTLEAAGVDPGEVDGVDVRTQTIELVQDDDAANTFARAYAVIGLARSGTVPPELLQMLLDQQCADGSFRIEAASSSTECIGDTDATAVAIQALAGAGEPADRALAWLHAHQQPDGSFLGGATTSTSNANSTGLGAQALQSGIELSVDDTPTADRHRRARDRASTWMVALAEQTANARSELDGAVAYDSAALARIDDVDDEDARRDQWRRSTAQALFALAPVPLSRIGSAQLRDAADAAGADSSNVTIDDDSNHAAVSSPFTVVIALLIGAFIALMIIGARRRYQHKEHR